MDKGNRITSVDDIELRGRPAIMKFLKVKTWNTAKKRLKQRGLFIRDGGQPVLNITAYLIRSAQIHLKDPE